MKLEEASAILEKVGLPADVTQIVGRKFCFEDGVCVMRNNAPITERGKFIAGTISFVLVDSARIILIVHTDAERDMSLCTEFGHGSVGGNWRLQETKFDKTRRARLATVYTGTLRLL